MASNEEPVTFSPGAEPESKFRRIGSAETFKRASQIFSKNWRDLLPITAIALAFICVVSYATVAIFIWASEDDYADVVQDKGFTWHILNPASPKTVVLAIENFIFFLIMCLSDGAIIHAVAVTYLEKQSSMRASVKKSFEKLHILSTSYIIIGIVAGAIFLIFAALVILVFPRIANKSVAFFFIFILVGISWGAIILMFVMTYHTYPVIIVENLGPIEAIKRSISLSDGHRGYILAVIMHLFIFKHVIGVFYSWACRGSYSLGTTRFGVLPQYSFGIEDLDGSDDDTDEEPYDASITLRYCIFQFIHVLLVFLISCFGSILQAATYLSVRSDRDGLTLVTLSQELGYSDDGNAYEMMPSEPSKTGEQSTTKETPAIV